VRAMLGMITTMRLSGTVTMCAVVSMPVVTEGRGLIGGGVRAVTGSLPLLGRLVLVAMAHHHRLRRLSITNARPEHHLQQAVLVYVSRYAPVAGHYASAAFDTTMKRTARRGAVSIGCRAA